MPSNVDTVSASAEPPGRLKKLVLRGWRSSELFRECEHFVERLHSASLFDSMKLAMASAGTFNSLRGSTIMMPACGFTDLDWMHEVRT